MQHETNRSPADEDDQADTAVLGLLLSPDEHGLWSVEEVERAMGERIATVDALARLHGAGLIHRFGEFVFATRAASAMDRMSF